MEKTPIKPEDIREGDLVRWERASKEWSPYQVVEYQAVSSGYPWTENPGQHYLLDRPKPPFEPYWGMVIGNPNSIAERGVYSPNRGIDTLPWLVYNESEGQTEWQTNDWAKQKLAEGWVVIEKPEGVPDRP